MYDSFVRRMNSDTIVFLLYDSWIDTQGEPIQNIATEHIHRISLQENLIDKVKKFEISNELSLTSVGSIDKFSNLEVLFILETVDEMLIFCSNQPIFLMACRNCVIENQSLPGQSIDIDVGYVVQNVKNSFAFPRGQAYRLQRRSY